MGKDGLKIVGDIVEAIEPFVSGFLFHSFKRLASLDLLTVAVDNIFERNRHA